MDIKDHLKAAEADWRADTGNLPKARKLSLLMMTAFETGELSRDDAVKLCDELIAHAAAKVQKTGADLGLPPDLLDKLMQMGLDAGVPAHVMKSAGVILVGEDGVAVLKHPGARDPSDSIGPTQGTA